VTRHPTFQHLAWRIRGHCRDEDPEQFFPNIRAGANFRRTVAPVAQTHCHPCPVRRECLSYALEIENEHGLWGGVWFRKPSHGRQERHPLTPGARADLERLQRRAS
jgi:hypothetical protein